jgi:hypothetical protein
MTAGNSVDFCTKPTRLRTYMRTTRIARPRPKQNSRRVACVVAFISVRAAIMRYRKYRRTRTTRRARFGLALSACSVLSTSKGVSIMSAKRRIMELKLEPDLDARASVSTALFRHM